MVGVPGGFISFKALNKKAVLMLTEVNWLALLLFSGLTRSQKMHRLYGYTVCEESKQ